jgi:RHS repeat-associated protein
VDKLDYLPFGEASTSAGPCPTAATTHKFTGKERDGESGLDNFGARYDSSWMGRFMSVDPSMLSVVMADPQSWNRYSYTLNNPLRYIDPNGECWVQAPSGAAVYDWTDRPNFGQNCHDVVAVDNGRGVTVYGSNGASDITKYRENEKFLVNVADMSQHHDAQFQSVQTPGREENYLASSQATALFNVALAYHGMYPNDSKLIFTGGSTASGESALDANGRPIHLGHLSGLNIDLRYMGANGRSLIGNSASSNGDVARNQAIMNFFGAANAGLGAALTGSPGRYGLGPIDAALAAGHQNHMHFQQNYPARIEPRIRPGQR